MPTVLSLRKHISPYAFLVIAVLFITLLVDIYAVDYGISYREIISTLGVLAGVSVLVAGRQGLKLGLVFLVVTFGLGYRTITIDSTLKVHPSELIILGLFALLIMQEAVWR